MEIIDPINEPKRWDQILSTHPHATVFHTSAWAKVLHRTYQHRPFYLRFQDGDKAPSALIPILEVRSSLLGRRGVSLPFTDYCEPLFYEGCNLDLIKTSMETLAHERRWKYLELRSDKLVASPSTAHCPPRTVCPPSTASRLPTFCAHDLDLTIGNERLLAACSSSVRRALRKAQRSPLTVRIERSSDAMRAFFRLHMLTRRRQGLPPQSYHFFQHIYEELVREGLGFIVSVFDETSKRPIAAAVFLNYNNAAIYKFGASDSHKWHLRPNNLVIWEGIRHLVDTGAKSLHFGRTSSVQSGLCRFKRSWGTPEKPLNYIRFDRRNKSWNFVKCGPSFTGVSKIIRQVFTYVPLSLNRVAGTLIYPHLD